MSDILLLSGRTGHNHTLARQKTTTLPGHSGMIHAMETPANAVSFKRDLPKEAQVTGYEQMAHAFLGTATLRAPAVIEHETHGHILLPAGNYTFFHQQEFNPWSNRMIGVFD